MNYRVFNRTGVNQVSAEAGGTQIQITSESDEIPVIEERFIRNILLMSEDLKEATDHLSAGGYVLTAGGYE